MSKFTDHPGFPGDGDNSIELHHSAPEYWTKKMTFWAVLMIVAFAVAAVVVSIWLMNNE